MPLVVPPNLLDEDDGLTIEAEDALLEIFDRYDLDKDGALKDEELDAFAMDTNGDVFDEDTRTEITGFLDVNEKGHLTRKGFLQMYNLQTPNDPEETWKDLQKHGYDANLKLVASRREDTVEKDSNASTNNASKEPQATKKDDANSA
ncbi:hypothetical protein DFQ27_002392 [Actinomortierella ambigua]|uniref:EF-hand domain-containing protein n=1 Tax=Actinomortierella ambigua TaxID=1343610 RepID=A0A9P6UCR9_9FUNG|nr:hypothetical protein DFQ26_009523 [Actinomortierella ambigua]KAG0269723.1 hypothetical protein DFQ27_002392 [Actinomortierella ambigua]